MNGYDKERLKQLLRQHGYKHNQTEGKQPIPDVLRKEYLFHSPIEQVPISIIYDLRQNDKIIYWIFDCTTIDYIKAFTELAQIKELHIIDGEMKKENVPIINGVEL